MTFPNMPDASLGADATHEAQLQQLCASLSDDQLAELGDLAEAMHTEAEGRSRFSALSAKLAAHGAHNPDALAAYIGRKKYGHAGFAALAKAGRKVQGGGHRATFDEALHPRIPAGGTGGGEFGKSSSAGKKSTAEKGSSPFHNGSMAYDPHSNRGPGYGMPHGDPTVKQLQAALNRLGLTDAHGKKLAVDGKLGPLTTQAIKAAQRRLGMKETGQVTQAFLKELQAAHGLPGEKKSPAHHHAKEAPKHHAKTKTTERPAAPPPKHMAVGGSGGNKIRSVTVNEWAVRAFEWEARSAGDDGRTLEGYAAVFGSPTRIADRGGDFDEVIRPGAFAKSLQRRKPVLQFDHGRDPRVGAVPIGSIQDISEDSRGLHVRARLFDNPVVEPVRQAIAEQAIRGMSFRFRVPDGGDTWTQRQGDVDLREIIDADTAELGPVVFPAYDTTSVTVRSMLAQLDPDEYDHLIRELAAQMRGAVDLTDFAGETDARGAVAGDQGTEPSSGRTVPVNAISARHAHAVARYLQGRNIRA